MNLYTMLLEYGGGTYIAQVEASSADDSFRKWLSKLRSDHIAGAISIEVADALADEEDGPTALDGLTGCWCVSGSGSRGFILVNLVRTVV
jgi:hypothetical protein